ncbi:MAG: AmmeMemoRadiSam system protein B [Planctomycetota bacterium]
MERSSQPNRAAGENSKSGGSSTGDTGAGNIQGLQLSEQQERSVFQAASELVVAGVANRAAELPDPTLEGAAEITVMGAFVTLKRRGQLRACCGTLGQPMPLIEALRGAAHRTATDDRRLPPISLTELPYLDVEVSLLHDFRGVEAKGDDRVGAVEIGRHGLTIQCREGSGLLLPHVAVENGWDRETFLRQLCHKAGLPAHAWKQDEARLQTFESLIIEGAIEPGSLASLSHDHPPLFTAEQIEVLSRHCRTNVLALMQGATPNYYVPACQDLNVQGVLLSLELPSRDGTSQFARLSLRPGLPLQSTLFQLCEAAVAWCRKSHVQFGEATDSSAHVSVLYDSAMHGTVADPDPRGIDPGRRAVIAAQHGRYAWTYEPGATPEQLVETVAHQAQIFDPRTAGLFSFAVDTNTSSFLVDNVPRPVAGPDVRPPAVSGVFYPAEPEDLRALVDQYLKEEGGRRPEPYPAVLVPHAGLRFSGRIAAAVYRRVAIPDCVIILAPKHSRLGTPWAVAPHKRWSLPGGTIDSDPELARRLSSVIPRLKLDAAAHQDEHAIEVQLPFLARMAPQSRVVGITVGEGDWHACQEFAEQLANVVRGQARPPLLVISTDLNHYAPETENRRLDNIALEAIEQLDPKRLFHAVRQHDISMCGLLPAVIVLQALRNLGRLGTCERVGYATSADAGGSRERVVGYAGLLFQSTENGEE